MSAIEKQVGFDLTEDAITEILCRLPVKALIRLTIICKTWQSLVHSPAFISKHLKQNPNPHSSTSMLVLSRHFSRDSYDMSLRSEEAPERPININFPFLRERVSLDIVGVSHGLVCLRRSRQECHLFVCNPSIRKFFDIPKPDDWKPLVVGDIAVGFTFDPYSNDYKLIQLLRSYSVSNQFLSEKARIYTMSTGCWREINIPSPIPHDLRLDWTSAVAVIDSVCYWSCHHFQSYNAVILSFNMKDELFGLISAPQDFRHLSTNTYTKFHLNQLNGQLAFFGINNLGVFTAWTLNADSVGWSMKFCVNLVPLVAAAVEVEVEEIGSEFGTFRLIGSCRDGEIVFEASKFSYYSLFSCDLVNEKIKELPFGAHFYYFRVDEYTESLLPVRKDE